MHFGVFSRARSIVCGLVMILLAALPVFSDVVYLKDGTILVATYKSTMGDTMTYSANGTELRLPVREILHSDASIDSLKGKAIALELTDKSVVAGSFADYDEDIGYFVDLSFGTITVPREKVVRMVDPVQSRKYQGSSVALGFRGLYLRSIANGNFGAMYGGGVTAEFGLPFARGLFCGADIDIERLETKGLDDLSYLLIQITPKFTYRYLEFRAGPGFLSRIVPFASLGVGMTAIYVHDARAGAYPDSYGALSPHVKTELGSDFYIKDNAYLRLGGAWMTVFQDGAAFSGAGATLALYYEL